MVFEARFSGEHAVAVTVEEFIEIVSRKLPIKRLSVSIRVESSPESVDTLSDGIKVREGIRGKRFPLQDREIDFDLVEPARMYWQSNSYGIAELLSKTLWECCRTVRAPLVDDPEYSSSRLVRLAGHDLVNETMKRFDTVRLFQASEDSRSANVKRGDVRPRAATLVLVLNMLTSPVGADIGVVNSIACLNACLLVGRDNKFVRTQTPAVPPTFIEIKNVTRTLGEKRITRPNPRAVSPGLDRVGVEDPPDRREADRVDMLLRDQYPVDVGNEKSAERFAAIRRNLTRDALDRGDHPRGGKTAAFQGAVCPENRGPLLPIVYTSTQQCFDGRRASGRVPCLIGQVLRRVILQGALVGPLRANMFADGRSGALSQSPPEKIRADKLVVQTSVPSLHFDSWGRDRSRYYLGYRHVCSRNFSDLHRNL